MFKKNCCDGIYNSMDVHFTSKCDNKCAHCIDMRFHGIETTETNEYNIAQTIIKNKDGYDDVLFLGGEPCINLLKLYDCIIDIKKHTDLKVYVTTSIPYVCYLNDSLFYKTLWLCDGMNFSVQHHDETIADKIRNTKSKYDRQTFYNNIPKELKKKIRINLNIVKPYLYTRKDLTDCLLHYDKMGFSEIKLSEIQHGKEYFVSFEKTFGIKLPSPYYGGCQTFIDTSKIIPEMKTPLLLKRSCFMCEETLSASFMDGIKVLFNFFRKDTNKYGVVYEDGSLKKGWV